MNNDEFCKYISNVAVKSMVYEVAASPKPGLVDRVNSGAHRDMDFFTFIDSSLALTSYFYNCSLAGIAFHQEDHRLLLRDIRPLGIEAEKVMFKATGGANTHKGLIFSLGIIIAGAGHIFSRKRSCMIEAQDLVQVIKAIGRGLTKELEGLRPKPKLTYGESLYLKYGLTGIRGEVEGGFPRVVDHALPLFKRLVGLGKYHINEIMVETLLSLMAHTEDSNILGRHNMDTLKYAQNRAKEAISLGGYLSEEGRLYVEDMDRDFIEKNISPGGSADLLAVTLMIYFLERGSGDILV